MKTHKINVSESLATPTFITALWADVKIDEQTFEQIEVYLENGGIEFGASFGNEDNGEYDRLVEYCDEHDIDISEINEKLSDLLRDEREKILNNNIFDGRREEWVREKLMYGIYFNGDGIIKYKNKKSDEILLVTTTEGGHDESDGFILFKNFDEYEKFTDAAQGDYANDNLHGDANATIRLLDAMPQPPNYWEIY